MHTAKWSILSNIVYDWAHSHPNSRLCTFSIIAKSSEKCAALSLSLLCCPERLTSAQKLNSSRGVMIPAHTMCMWSINAQKHKLGKAGVWSTRYLSAMRTHSTHPSPNDPVSQNPLGVSVWAQSPARPQDPWAETEALSRTTDSICHPAENIHNTHYVPNSKFTFMWNTSRVSVSDLQQNGAVDLSQGLVQGADGRLQHGGHQDGSVQVLLGHHTRMRFEEQQNPAVTVHVLQLHRDKTSHNSAFSSSFLRMFGCWMSWAEWYTEHSQFIEKYWNFANYHEYCSDFNAPFIWPLFFVKIVALK